MLKWIAFGSGCLSSALASLVLAMIFRVNDPYEYATYSLIWFGVGYGLSMLALHSPEIYLMYLEYLDRAAVLELSTARKRKEIDDLNGAPVLDNDRQPRVVYDRAAKWREWYISVFDWSGESIHYKDHLDQVITYDLWRNVLCKALSDHVPTLIEPVTNGSRTELRGGLTVASVVFMLRSGTLTLPYPESYDPPPPIAKNANAETREKRGETQQTVYAKDIKR